jgi:ATP-dependent Zn protease
VLRFGVVCWQVSVSECEQTRNVTCRLCLAGPARTAKVQRPDVLRNTAFHEAGHTLAAILTKHTGNLHKVTILPRGHSGGAVRVRE